MKRKALIAVLGAVCLSTCAAGLSACDLFGSQSTDVVADGIKYELTNDNTYCVSGYENAGDTRDTLVIPEEVNGVGVTEIARFAFEGSTALKNVSIPASVTKVNVGAFKGCTSVESMKLPYVTTQGGGWDFGYHFGDDANAENKDVVPATLKSVELICETELRGKFKDCTSLETVVLPDTLTYVGRYIFENCTSLKSIIIPDSVTQIEYAFKGCTSLESLTVPHVGEFRNPSESSGTPRTNFGFVFQGTSENSGIPESLKTVKITAATEIDDYAFRDCSDIENVILSESLMQIGASAFYGCTSLKSVNIPSEITEINRGAFIGCENLDITVPENVTSVKQEAFKNCTNLKIKLSEGLLSIGNSAFEDCTNLEIAIPSSVTSVANGAFTGCTKAITEEGGLSYVDKWLIGGGSNETAVIKEGTVGIASVAFTKSVKNVTIPETMRNISTGAFRNAGRLNVNYNGDIESWCNITFGDSEANPLSCASDIKMLYDGEYVTALTIYGEYGYAIEIPESVTKINSYAFAYYSDLEAVYIPASVTEIGGAAFYSCSNLKNIIFGGTRAEWEKVEKGNRWDSYVGGGEYNLHCADDAE